MKQLLRALALGIGPVVMVTMGLVSVEKAKSLPRLASPLPVSASSCTQPITFKTVYEQGKDYVKAQGEGFYFGGESIIGGNVCSAGVLKIIAAGEIAENEKPQLLIMLDNTIIATPSFSEPENIEVPIPHAGRIYLGFLNDYYLADVRVATLSSVKLTAINCQGFKSVSVPADSAGMWYPETQMAVLTRDIPSILVPCAAGELSMNIEGRKGDGAYPILTFKQNGQIIKVLQTTEESYPFSVPVNASPLSVTVKNAYGVTLGDRNLILQLLEFVPRQP